MATDPLDLWPEAIRLNPLTPLSILKMQASRLGEKTRGLLTAEVDSTGESPPADDPNHPWEKPVVLRFEIVAAALDGYRHQLLVCSHEKDYAYPVAVTSGVDDCGVPDTTWASGEEELKGVLKGILGSKRTRALLESLLARITEKSGDAAAKSA